MSFESELPASLAEVAQRCRDETERFFRRLIPDTRFCMELFRRGLARREGDAFAHVIANYTPLVDMWVKRHSAFPKSGEESSYFVTAAFEKLWMAVSPARFARFVDLKALLSYLKLCVHSSIIDHLRSQDCHASLGDEGQTGSSEPVAPAPLLSSPERAEIWSAVMQRVQNEKEQLVLHACFALRMKPGEVIEAFPEVFQNAQELYRTKQNLLERLRRDQALRKYLAPYA